MNNVLTWRHLLFVLVNEPTTWLHGATATDYFASFCMLGTFGMKISDSYREQLTVNEFAPVWTISPGNPGGCR